MGKKLKKAGQILGTGVGLLLDLGFAALTATSGGYYPSGGTSFTETLGSAFDTNDEPKKKTETPPPKPQEPPQDSTRKSIPKAKIPEPEVHTEPPLTPPLASTQSEAKKTNPPPPPSEPITEAQQKSITQAMDTYKKYGKDETGNYKKGFEEPKQQGAVLRFVFPDNQSALAVLKEYAQNNKAERCVVRNDNGEIIAQIRDGKLNVFDGKKGFKEADEHSVIPKVGLSQKDYDELDKPTPPHKVSLFPNAHGGDPIHQADLKKALVRPPTPVPTETETDKDEKRTDLDMSHTN